MIQAERPPRIPTEGILLLIAERRNSPSTLARSKEVSRDGAS
jgi:hypothetical protein